MKLSVSVPDDLWANVYRPGDKPSGVVQRGLRLLAAEKQRLVMTPAVSEEVAGALVAHTDRLARQARTLYQRGYELGLEVARVLEWVQLESFQGAENPLASLSSDDWEDRRISLAPADEPDPADLVFVLQAWVAAQPDIAFGPDAEFELRALDFGPTFNAGLERALLDVQEAVRKRLNDHEAAPERDHVESPTNPGTQKGS